MKILASLDVISLFTNIPIDLVSKSIEKRWDYIIKNTTIPLNEFLSAVNFVLDSMFFIFNQRFYKQIFGTLTGSPISPNVAEIVLQDLEISAIRILPMQPLFYYIVTLTILF